MGKKPQYVNCCGLIQTCMADAEHLNQAKHYYPDPGEIIITSYPKCGSTWCCQIVVLILRKGQPPQDPQEWNMSHPFIDLVGVNAIKHMRRPGVVKTHLPFDEQNFNPQAKYINIVRNPADCLVSFYHHTKFFPGYRFSDGTFDDYFDCFVKGEVDYNDYFDHVLSWYEKRHEPNVFFGTYEDMKKDTVGMILKIAKFLGEEYYQDLVADEKILENVVKFSSFEYMQETINGYCKMMFAAEPPEGHPMEKTLRQHKQANLEGHNSIGEFIRKGEIGDGKNTLSSEQMDRLKDRIREKTSHSDVMELWKDYFDN